MQWTIYFENFHIKMQVVSTVALTTDVTNGKTNIQRFSKVENGYLPVYSIKNMMKTVVK